MNAKSELLTGRQQQAAFLLASGCTSSSVVQELKIHRATLANWQRRPEFEAFVNQLLEHGRAAAQAKMINLSTKAVSALENLLDSSSEKIRLATASEILRHLSEVKVGPSRAAAIRSERAFEGLSDIGEAFTYRERGETS